MGEPDIPAWFDGNWMKVRDRALKQGWESLSRRDQVLTAVGFLMDSMVGSGVEMIVDGMADGSDEGLTVHMPDALRAIGQREAARHMEELIRLRTPSGSKRKDQANRELALDHWAEVGQLFDEWIPGGERLMLTMLYDWYRAQPS